MFKFLRTLLASLLLLAWSSPVIAQPVSLDIRVAANNDDAEQDAAGTMNVGDTILDLGEAAWMGLRFSGVTIPPQATVLRAHLQFVAADTDKSNASVTIFAQDANNPGAFGNGRNNISNRTRTSNSATWANVAAREKGGSYQSPDLKAIVQEIVDRSGWKNGNSVVFIVRSDAATGKRSVAAREAGATTAVLLHVEYTTEEPPAAPDLLLIVADANNLTKQEWARCNLLEGWAYNVTPISASASAKAFAAACAQNDVAYVVATVDPKELAGKLRPQPLGVVNEQAWLHAELGLASKFVESKGKSLIILPKDHYLTSAFGAGSLSVFGSTQRVVTLAGTTAPDLTVLGAWGFEAALATLEAGGERYDETMSAGRRVALPWASSEFSFGELTSDGQKVLRRAIVWAAGIVGYWKLDETSGTIAYDAANNANHGALGGGLNFKSDSVAPAQIDSGLQLDGDDDLVTVTDVESLRLTKALSIAGWIRGDAWGTGNNVSTILRKGKANSSDFQLAVRNGRVMLCIEEGDNKGDLGDTTLATNQWYHVVATWDGEAVCIYVDGRLDQAGPVKLATKIKPGTDDLYLGGRAGGDFFAGVLDDVRLFNYALGADEIAALMNVGHGNVGGVMIVKWREIK